MKTITQQTYRNLPLAARMNALVAAEARGDDREARRLMSGNPAHFRPILDQLGDLRALSVACEADVRELLLCFVVSLNRGNDEAGEIALQKIADLREALRLTLESAGIDATDFAKAGPPQSEFFELVAPLLPEPDQDRAAELTAMMKV